MIRDAAELRIKETDRIATVAENFKRMGIEIEVTPDGMRIPGKPEVSRRDFRFVWGSSGLRWRLPVAALAGPMGNRRLKLDAGFGIVSGILGDFGEGLGAVDSAGHSMDYSFHVPRTPQSQFAVSAGEGGVL